MGLWVRKGVTVAYFFVLLALIIVDIESSPDSQLESLLLSGAGNAVIHSSNNTLDEASQFLQDGEILIATVSRDGIQSKETHTSLDSPLLGTYFSSSDFLLQMGINAHSGEVFRSISSNQLAKEFNSFFGTANAGQVRLANQNGMMIQSVSTKSDEYNAVFSNGSVTKVQIAKNNGMAFSSLSDGSGTFNAVFQTGLKSEVYLAHPNGTNILSQTKGQLEWNSKFVNSSDKTECSLLVAHGDGSTIYSETKKSEKPVWNSTFTNSSNNIINVAHSDGRGIISITSGDTVDKSLWNAFFSFKGLSEVRLGQGQGIGVHSLSSVASSWSGEFTSNPKQEITSSVKLALGQGTGIASTTSLGNAWNAVFENSTGQRSIVSISHTDGSGIKASCSTFSPKIASGTFINGSFLDVQLSHGSGSAIVAKTNKGAPSAWNTIINSNCDGAVCSSKVSIGDNTGKGIYSSSPTGVAGEGRGWNSYFGNKTIASLYFAANDGQTIYSYTSSPKEMVWNAFFGNSATVEVHLAHGTGQGINSTTATESPGVFNAFFGSDISKVHLVGDGCGIVAQVAKGPNEAGIFQSHLGASVHLSSQAGAIQAAVTRENTDTARFDNIGSAGKPTIIIGAGNGSGVVSTTMLGSSAEFFRNSRNSKGDAVLINKTIIGSESAAIMSTTIDPLFQWNSQFIHPVSAVNLAGKTAAIYAEVSGSKIWGAVITNKTTAALSIISDDGVVFKSTVSGKVSSFQAQFETTGVVSTLLTSGTGTGIYSETISGSSVNAEFRYKDKTSVQIGGPVFGLRSVTVAGDDWNGIFSNAGNIVQLAHGKLAALSATSASGHCAGQFTHTYTDKTSPVEVHIATLDHIGVQSTASSPAGIAGLFRHDGVSVRLSSGEGVGISSQTTIATASAGYFTHSDKSEVTIASSTGTALIVKNLIKDSIACTATIESGKIKVCLGVAGGNIISGNSEYGSTLPLADFSLGAKTASNPPQVRIQLGTPTGNGIIVDSDLASEFQGVFCSKNGSVNIGRGDGASIIATSSHGSETEWNSQFGHERGKNWVNIGSKNGTAIHAHSVQDSFWTAFIGAKAAKVHIGHTDGHLIHGNTHKSSTKNWVMILRNNDNNNFLVRDDGHVEVGENGTGFFKVNGRAYIEGDLIVKAEIKKGDSVDSDEATEIRDISVSKAMGQMLRMISESNQMKETMAKLIEENGKLKQLTNSMLTKMEHIQQQLDDLNNNSNSRNDRNVSESNKNGVDK